MNIFDINLIKVKMAFSDKKSLFEAMVEDLCQQGIVTDKESFLSALLTREDIMSTGIGFGIGLPHGRHTCVTELKVAVYILEEGVPFDSLDGLPVNIVFMVAIPQKAGNEYMKVLNLLSGTLHEDMNRVFFSKTDDIEKIYEYLEGLENES
ncbi:MAG: fructose PTS transporter subunit IIA [Candidatus Cloacimonetes bacterium]|nr:fructose PTS transporter subunit IIA [Candidatus Cloacimonadota bacterium]